MAVPSKHRYRVTRLNQPEVYVDAHDVQIDSVGVLRFVIFVEPSALDRPPTGPTRQLPDYLGRIVRFMSPTEWLECERVDEITSSEFFGVSQ